MRFGRLIWFRVPWPSENGDRSPRIAWRVAMALRVEWFTALGGSAMRRAREMRSFPARYARP